MSAVGSVVQGMPVVASLRRAWREARIAWVLQPGPASLMAGRPDADRVITFHRHLGTRAYALLRRETAAESFDLVLCLQPNFKGALVARLLPGRMRLGYDRRRSRDASWLAWSRRIPARPVAHVQDELLEFLDCLGVPRVMEWDFHFSPEERERARRWRRSFARPVLAIVPRSSSRRKDWTLEGMARVIDAAASDLGLDPVLVGGDSPGEVEDGRRLARRCAAPLRLELGGSLRRLAGRLAESDVVVAPDTGPLHMAVALGTPTVGLYGRTDPLRSGPYGRFAELLVDRHGGATGPDGKRRPTWATRRGRMRQIGAEEVLEKVERALRIRAHRKRRRGEEGA